MKKVICVFLVIIILTGCVTNHYTGEDYLKKKKVPDQYMSVLTGCIPGLSQLSNGEYIEAAVYFLGSSIPFFYFMNSGEDEKAIFIPLSVWTFSFIDGLVTTRKRNKEYKDIENAIALLGRAEKNRIKNIAIERALKNNMPILIKDYYVSKNRADGINCYISCTNISEKRVKYITYTIIPYNRVNDVVKTKTTLVTITDFINPREEYSGIVENAFLDTTIDRIEISGIEVVYDDDTKTIITSLEDIKNGSLNQEESEIFKQSDKEIGLPIFTKSTLKSK